MLDIAQIILLPFLTAIVGWGTNRLAIHFLFHPVKEWRLGPFKLQGLIPRRREAIASRMADLVADDLDLDGQIKAHFKQLDMQPYLREHIHHLVHTRIAAHLEKMPFLAMFQDKALQVIESILLEEMSAEASDLMRGLAGAMQDNVNVRDHVYQRIVDFDADRLEQLIRGIAQRELRAIEWMGAILGGLVGIVQCILIWIAW